jgi:hypothetical protein
VPRQLHHHPGCPQVLTPPRTPADGQEEALRCATRIPMRTPTQMLAFGEGEELHHAGCIPAHVPDARRWTQVGGGGAALRHSHCHARTNTDARIQQGRQAMLCHLHPWTRPGCPAVGDATTMMTTTSQTVPAAFAHVPHHGCPTGNSDEHNSSEALCCASHIHGHPTPHARGRTEQ